MFRLTASEWQSFPFNKGIEKICHRISEGLGRLRLSVGIEVAVVFLAVFLDRLLGLNGTFWYIFPYLLVFLATLTILFVWGAREYKNKKHQEKKTPQDLIELFDNEICYYIMTAVSFLEMLNEELNVPGRGLNKAKFYFVETRFYFNKAVGSLTGVQFNLSDVFSTDSKTIYLSHKISSARLDNALDLLNEVYESLCDIDSNSLHLPQPEYEQICVGEHYNQLLRNFQEEARDAKLTDRNYKFKN